MFLDAARIPSGHVQRSRVCVFGSGPAGVTLARALARRDVPVLLVEAGSDEYEETSQEFYRGTVIGDDYYDLSEARLRMFGGTSNHWEGYCIPLGAHDFEPHPHFPHTGWPISKTDLDPYLAEACDVLSIPNRFEERRLGLDVRQTQFQFSEVIGIGEKYRDEFAASSNLKVCLNSALIGVQAADGKIVSTTVRSVSGNDWAVEADYYVMCMGGIENSRLLLWFNEQNDRQLIANHGIIGRYWMEHPHALLAEALFTNEEDIFFREGEASFAMSREFQVRNKILNAGILVNAQPYSDTKRLIASIGCVAPDLGRRMAKLLGKQMVCGARIRSHYEQAPVYENRVALGREVDAFGIPRPELHWRLGENDRETILTTIRAFAEQIAELDLGRVLLDDWIRDDAPVHTGDTIAGWHHMGGTRMSRDATEGVVDANLRIHDLTNLYVGGSSVFPTGGYANPTLTIVQLSLRLADHFEIVLSGSNQ